MKRLLILFLILVLPSAAFAKVKESDMMQGVKLAEKKPADTSIVFGANEPTGGITEPGWPIIVSAAVDSKQDPSPNIPTNLTLQMTDQAGKAVQMTFDPVARPAGSDQAQAFWIAANTNLTPGEYTISAVPVKGFTIEPGILTVEAANADNATKPGLLNIQKLLLSGKDKEALAEADRLISVDAKDSDALIAKGDILMGQDRPDEALEVYNQALEIEAKTEPEPLFLEERRSSAFSRSLEKRGVLKSTKVSQP